MCAACAIQHIDSLQRERTKNVQELIESRILAKRILKTLDDLPTDYQGYDLPELLNAIEFFTVGLK
jgi:hypothetical protein